MQYNSPYWAVSGGQVVQGNPSNIGPQIKLDVMVREALEEKKRETYFTQLSNNQGIEPNSGKRIKRFKYIPLLRDENTSTVGLDGSGNAVAGNLYGGSRNIDVIQGKLPVLGEEGGRVNRVGFTRVVVESDLHKYGFYYDFTEDEMSFDSDPEVLQHMSRESIHGAMEIQEDTLGIELLKGAGVHQFAGSATSLATMSGESGTTTSIVTYKDLQRLATTLKENNAPMSLKATPGTRLVDSKIVGAGFVLYAGYELEVTLRNLKDAAGNPVFIPVEKYAGGGKEVLNGEIGCIGQFRIIIVPKMPVYNAAGAEDVGADSVLRTSAGYVGNTNNPANTDTAKQYYDVFPLMAVSSEAFSTYSFRTSGKGMNFKMISKLPGAEIADTNNPYGSVGFTSIQWHHATLIDRPEWIAVQYSLAEI